MATTVDTPFGPVDVETGERSRGMTDAIAIFNPALKAMAVPAEEPIIVLAIGGTALLCVNVSGQMSWRDTDSVQLDWRYDFKTESWVDVNGESLEAAE